MYHARIDQSEQGATNVNSDTRTYPGRVIGHTADGRPVRDLPGLPADERPAFELVDGNPEGLAAFERAAIADPVTNRPVITAATDDADTVMRDRAVSVRTAYAFGDWHRGDCGADR